MYVLVTYYYEFVFVNLTLNC